MLEKGYGMFVAIGNLWDIPMLISAALENVDYRGGIPRMLHILLHTLADMER